MQSTLLAIYPFLKIGHVIFMVFWLAGLFMLPRQCIYMLDHAPGSEGEAKWATRMGKLRKIILTPSLIIVWVLGLAMAIAMGLFQRWLASCQADLGGGVDRLSRLAGGTDQEDGGGGSVP